MDFVYASLQSIGYNQDKFEGDLWPGNNKDNVKGLLYGFGAQIVRDDLTRHGAYYDTGAGQSCMWLSPADSVNASPVKNEFALTTDTLSGIKYKESIDHDAAAAQVSNGLVTSGGGWNLSYDPNKLNLNQYQGNWVNNTFTAAATQIWRTVTAPVTSIRSRTFSISACATPARVSPTEALWRRY
ncbi:hypothetical protein QZH47_21670 [Pseudomonas corrugata]